MPQPPAPPLSTDPLDALQRDVARLLLAGAGLAPADEDLAAHARALETLAARAPALAPVCAQLEAVRAAPPSAAARPLLALAQLLRHARRALARGAHTDGPLEPLPARVPLDTPLSAHDTARALGTLLAALAGREPRPWVPPRPDLRLLRHYLYALGSPLVGDFVAAEVLPRFGRAAEPALRALLARAGPALAPRVLSALLRIASPDRVRALADALASSTPAVRAVALVALDALQPTPAELAPALRALTASDRAETDRAMAARALGRLAAPDDPTLDALTAALCDPSAIVRDEAFRALRLAPRAVVVARLAPLLAPERWTLPAGAWAHVLTLLQSSPSEALRDALRAVCDGHPDEAVRREVAELLRVWG